MTAYQGIVGADGRSIVPDGVVDTSYGAESVEVSPEVQARLDDLFKGQDLDNIKARYKLEVAINDERSRDRPFTGLITAWTNGGFNSGGGDEAVYFCSSLVNDRTCSAPLDLKWIGKHTALCPSCRQAIEPKELAGQIGAKLTFAGWAGLITKIWNRLGGDADIRIGVMTGSLHRRTEDVLQGGMASAGDKLDNLRGKREWSIYPLRNIVKDTAAGADLQGRILAFISA